ncbi:MAG: hypothetical protein ACE5LU_00960 [Anaerolineae bacterium]
MGLAKRSTRISCQRTNAEWLASLRSRGLERDRALADLRAYFIRGVLVYLSRHHSDLRYLDRDGLLQFAEECTLEALVTVEKKLDNFRGDSRFTTWAYRFAIVQAAGKLRQPVNSATTPS